MEYILIYIFNSNKKESDFLKFFNDDKKKNNFDKYDKFIFNFLKHNVISKSLCENVIIEYNEFIKDTNKKKYLLFLFNLEEIFKKKDFLEIENLKELNVDLYDLLNYRNNNNNGFINYLYNNNKNNNDDNDNDNDDIDNNNNNIIFEKEKKYNFIITTENNKISQIKTMLKNDKIYENIYFNTNYNNSIKNIIKESQVILFNN